MDLAEWIETEYARARAAVIRARRGRVTERPSNPQALEFVSAMARMCALGEAREQLANRRMPAMQMVPVNAETRPLGARRLRVLVQAQEQLTDRLAQLQAAQDLTDAEVSWILAHVTEVLARRQVEQAWADESAPGSRTAAIDVAATTVLRLRDLG